MGETGWRHWICFGVFSAVVVGAVLVASGLLVGNLLMVSCGC